MSRVLTDDSDAIEYLRGLEVEPGAKLALEGIAPFEGPVSLRIAERTLHLGRRVAQPIHVGEDTKPDPATVRTAARKPPGRA